MKLRFIQGLLAGEFLLGNHITLLLMVPAAISLLSIYTYSLWTSFTVESIYPSFVLLSANLTGEKCYLTVAFISISLLTSMTEQFRSSRTPSVLTFLWAVSSWSLSVFSHPYWKSPRSYWFLLAPNIEIINLIIISHLLS